MFQMSVELMHTSYGSHCCPNRLLGYSNVYYYLILTLCLTPLAPHPLSHASAPPPRWLMCSKCQRSSSAHPYRCWWLSLALCLTPLYGSCPRPPPTHTGGSRVPNVSGAHAHPRGRPELRGGAARKLRDPCGAGLHLQRHRHATLGVHTGVGKVWGRGEGRRGEGGMTGLAFLRSSRRARQAVGAGQ